MSRKKGGSRKCESISETATISCGTTSKPWPWLGYEVTLVPPGDGKPPPAQAA